MVSKCQGHDPGMELPEFPVAIVLLVDLKVFQRVFSARNYGGSSERFVNGDLWSAKSLACLSLALFALFFFCDFHGDGRCPHHRRCYDCDCRPDDAFESIQLLALQTVSVFHPLTSHSGCYPVWSCIFAVL